MRNPGLMTALGTLGAGFSAYGQEQERRAGLQRQQEALDRALEEQRYQRSRQEMEDKLRQDAINRAIEQQDFDRTRTSQRDVLEAILGGLRPQGGAEPLTIGGRAFEVPNILTPDEQVQARKRRFMIAYPNISEAQAELMARGEMRPGEVLIDPGTARPGNPRTPTPIVLGKSSLFQRWKTAQEPPL